ncbi:MAG: hypothetical protein LBM74_03515 [Oscillospiraceae bacterium]|jgi:hypothetical protein|nr:hypothetical protein [Oscillospiraceae bacterium]
MRRFFCILLTICLLGALPVAVGEELALASQALFAALMAKDPQALAQMPQIDQTGDWLSAVARIDGADGAHSVAAVYDLAAGALVTWDDLFLDGEAAAAHLEALAGASQGNTYHEFNQIHPIPRDHFALRGGQLFIYYPREQLAHVSGNAGAYAFYAYEMPGLLQEGVPLATGDVTQAAAGLLEVLETGALPAPYAAWSLGNPMANAAAALTQVDVPNLTHDYAVYAFEAPEMRGVSLLAHPDATDADSALIAGVYAQRIDFFGLCTGIATRAQCEAALGQPDAVLQIEEVDAYSRLPVGETLLWQQGGRALELHFVEGVLHSITLREANTETTSKEKRQNAQRTGCATGISPLAC